MEHYVGTQESDPFAAAKSLQIEAASSEKKNKEEGEKANKEKKPTNLNEVFSDALAQTYLQKSPPKRANKLNLSLLHSLRLPCHHTCRDRCT